MRTVFKILLLLLVGFTSKAQTPLPAGLPSPKSTSWAEYGWLQGDSGIINAKRDTTFRSRFAGTQIMWQHAGVDTNVWYNDGRAYFTYLRNINGLIGPGTNVTITGSGKPGDPYIINSSGGGGSGNFNSFNFTPANGLTGTVTGATGPNVNLTLGTALNGIINANGTGFGTVTIGTGLTYVGGVLSAGTTLNGLISANGSAFTTANIGAGLSFVGNTLTNTINNTNQLTNGAGFLTNITGLVTAGTNVTITGNGTAGNPYVINSGGGGGSITGAGNLSPLFTTSVSVGTINFAFINPVAGRIFGNPTGSTAAPIFFGTDATLHFAGNLLGADTTVVASKAFANTFYRAVSQIDDSTFTLNRPDGTKDTVQIKVNFPGGIATLNNGLTLIGTNGQWGGSLIQNTVITGAGFYTQFNGGRLETGQGATVASANDLVLGNDGNLFPISGNVVINAITATNWQAGSIVAFIFSGTPTLKNNTIGGAGTIPMLLAGGIDYTAAPGDYIMLQSDGSFWHEVTRKLASSGGVYVFSNGLLESPATQVKLGGSLTATTTINTGTFTLNLTGTAGAGNSIIVAGNTGAGSGGAFSNNSTSNATINVSNVAAGTGVSSLSNGGVPLYGQTQTGVTNSVLVGLQLRHNVIAGNGANGIGTSIEYDLATTTTSRLSNTINSIWVDATDATRSSEFSISTVSNGVTITPFKIQGNGQTTLIGSVTGDLLTVNQQNTGNNGGVRGISIDGGGVIGVSSTNSGVTGSSTTGNGGNFNSTSGIALTANSGSSQMFSGSTTPSSTNTVTTAATFFRGTTGGTSGSGIGGDILLTSPSTTLAASGVAIRWKLTDATNATVTSQLILRGQTNGGVMSDWMTLDGTSLILPGEAGIAIQATTNSTQVAGSFRTANSTTNSVTVGLNVNSLSTGSPANGIGTGIDLMAATTTSNNRVANSMQSSWTNVTDASRSSQWSLTGVTAAVTSTWLNVNGLDGFKMGALRFETIKGAIVASAGDLTLGNDGNVFHISGTTTINAITTANWQDGAIIRLIFDGSLTVKNNTAGGGGTAVFKLSGGVDFSATADDVLTVVKDGARFLEVSRSVN